MTSILALDTATNACSAAIWVDGQIIASRFEEMPRGHSESLVPMVAEITKEAKCPVKGISLVAVTIGPGAFTGIRIGLATARGFALSSRAPCLGFTTLEVIAANIPMPTAILLVAIDSKRENIYFQIFEPDCVAYNNPSIATLEQIGEIIKNFVINDIPITLAGDAAAKVSEYLAENRIPANISDITHPNASVLAKLAASRWSSSRSIKPPSPMYLQQPDAALPVLGGRLRP